MGPRSHFPGLWCNYNDRIHVLSPLLMSQHTRSPHLIRTPTGTRSPQIVHTTHGQCAPLICPSIFPFISHLSTPRTGDYDLEDIQRFTSIGTTLQSHRVHFTTFPHSSQTDPPLSEELREKMGMEAVRVGWPVEGGRVRRSRSMRIE